MDQVLQSVEPRLSATRFGARALELLGRVFIVCLVLAFFSLFLLSENYFRRLDGGLPDILREISAALDDPGTQWVFAATAAIYAFSAIALLQHWSHLRFIRWVNHDLWLSLTLGLAVCAYAVGYGQATQSTEAVTFFAGLALGKIFGVWQAQAVRRSSLVQPLDIVPLALLLLLAATAIWRLDYGVNARYRSIPRWSGPWANPNIYGLLMGVGIILACGFALRLRRSIIWTWPAQAPRAALAATACILALVVLARALLHTFSRGAWLSTGIGLVYLLASWHPPVMAGLWTFLRRNLVALMALGLAVGIFAAFHGQRIETAYVRRVFSVSNVNDFSWRNRFTTWEGALQIIADHPWVGVGWGQPESIYDHYYRDINLDDPQAIEMNDYLMLGATLGVPALAGFLGCLSCCFPGHCPTARDGLGSASDGAEARRTMCRAGALVIAIGFFFDGGLFKLPVALTFWSMLTLSLTPSSVPEAT